MQHTPLFRRIAIATGLIGALGAVTAFGVAPLTELELPPVQSVVDPLPLSIRFPDSLDRFSQVEVIRKGDTLAELLDRAGANDAEFLRFAASDPIGRKALQMRPGRSVRIDTDGVGRVTNFVYRLADFEDAGAADADPRVSTRIGIWRESGRLVAREESIPLERSVEMRSVEIQTTLFAATDAANIPENIAIRVANIFGGEVDFSRELRKGDRLRIVYESLREQGSLDAPRAGRVLAVELVNRGKRYDAFWFQRDGHGEYFTFDGRSLKTAFLRNPLEFSRLTSGFSGSRLHPIHNDWRAHKGVDFFAPAGTPVRASADGIVEMIGSQRGYGNMIVLRHKAPHSTVYAHLSAFAPGLAQGRKVRQGEVIGNVGATGWATGPHLHYEIKVNGVQVDPMQVAFIEGTSLEGPQRQQLATQVSALREQFSRLDSLRLARFE
ncbi:MAG: hypothetical protein RIS35_855 [Pseudomonadota bacterium]